jgi:hypothetical protein
LGFLKLNFSGFVKTISAPLEQKSEISGRKIAKAVRFVPTQKRAWAFSLRKRQIFLADEKIWPSSLNFSMQPCFKCLIKLKLKMEACKIEKERSNDRSP